MIGETVEDLIRWENWLAEKYNIDKPDVCGISCGGDLSIFYPVFSDRVNRIFCSGSIEKKRDLNMPERRPGERP